MTELGSNPPEIDNTKLCAGMPKVDTDHSLDSPPNNPEILKELGHMRESAPGSDEVSANFYKCMSSKIKKELCKQIRALWKKTPPAGYRCYMTRWDSDYTRKETTQKWEIIGHYG